MSPLLESPGWCQFSFTTKLLVAISTFINGIVKFSNVYTRQKQLKTKLL